MAALSDQATRRAVLPNLNAVNFVEATAEDLSDGIRLDPRYGPMHAASKPRHAFNSFQWSLPTTLPTSGGPDALTSEVHSFARVFTGCFYDSIRNVFASLGAPTEAKLLAATKTVAKLLVAGARQAPEVPRLLPGRGPGHGAGRSGGGRRQSHRAARCVQRPWDRPGQQRHADAAHEPGRWRAPACRQGPRALAIDGRSISTRRAPSSLIAVLAAEPAQVDQVRRILAAQGARGIRFYDDGFVTALT